MPMPMSCDLRALRSWLESYACTVVVTVFSFSPDPTEAGSVYLRTFISVVDGSISTKLNGCIVMTVSVSRCG